MPRQIVSAYPAVLDFSGAASNVASVPYVFPTDAFTVTFRYKAKVMGALGIATNMFAANEGWFFMAGSFSAQRQATNDFQIYAYLNAPNNFAGPRRLRFRNLYQPNGDGNWHTRAWVIYVEGGTAKCDEYEDGVKLGNTHLVDYTGDTNIPNGSLSFGKSQTVNFNGLMARVRIYNRRLTASEVAQDHFGRLPYAPDANWRLSEGVGPTIVDSSGNGNNGVLTGGSYSADVPMKARRALNGNLLENGDFEFVPPFVALQTSSGRWVDGTAIGSTTNDLFKVSVGFGNGGGEIGFDSTVKYAGQRALYLHNQPGGYVEARLDASSYYQARGQQLLPNTAYVLAFRMKTELVGGDASGTNDGAFMQYLVASALGSASGSFGTTRVRSATDWTEYSLAFTTGPTAAWGHPEMRLYGHTGTIDTLEMKAWFDNLSLVQANLVSRQLITGPFRQPISNLIRNGDFEFFPALVAPTNVSQQYVDGTAAGSASASQYGAWATVSIGAGGNASFDPTVSHSGKASMKLDLPLITSSAVISQAKSGTSPISADIMEMLPSIQYRLTGWLKTANVPANGAFIDLREYSGARAALTTTSTTKVGGTVDWIQVSATITTTATTRFGQILLRNGTPGNVCTAWFDDLVLTPMVPIDRSAA